MNINAQPTNTAQPIQTNSLAQQSLSAFNTNAISANVEAIDVNTQAIQANRVLIDQAFAGIGENATAIQANLSSISDVEEGLAAVAALPDSYLNPREKWSAAGGFATFGDEIGFGANLAIRGDENWSFGGAAAIGGDEVTTKVQVRYGGF